MDSKARLDHLAFERSRIVEKLLFAWGAVLLPLTLLVIYFGFELGWPSQSLLELGVVAFMWVVIFSRRLLAVEIRALLIGTVIIIAVLGEVYYFGLLLTTPAALAVLPMLGTVIGGARIGLLVTVVIAAALAAIGWSIVTTEKPPPVELPAFLWNSEEWIFRVAMYLIAVLSGVWVSGALYRLQSSSIEAMHQQNSELERSNGRIEHSTRLAGLGHAIADLKSGQVVECDDAYARMHGMTAEEFTSLDVRSGIIQNLIHEDDRAAAMEVRTALMAGEPMIRELRHRMPDGEIRYLRKIFAPMTQTGPAGGFYEVVCQDVTDARQMQEQLFRTQKTDAIGKLTGGIAHDFNNLLAVILGNLELLEDKISGSDEKDLVKNAKEATLRGSELTRNMLSFARKAPLTPTVVDLNQLVRDLKNWTARTLPSTIQVEISLLAGLWPVKIDASSAESAVLNLIVNARDAMPGGGELTIETSNVRVDEDYVDLRGEDIAPGRYVLLAISDTGEGIPPEHLDKIFDPFFTTKPVGSGSGLGLSMLQGFMKQSGGTVRVYSEPKVGTTFKLYFPAQSSPESTARDMPDAQMQDTTVIRATILLVEDNADVLAAMRTMLVNEGYRVLDAASGDEALDVFKANPGIDLLLTDIVMPGELQGTTLATTLRAMRADLPVVFMSGYASEATVHGNGLRPEDIRLMKPIQRRDLMQAVRQALSRDPGDL